MTTNQEYQHIALRAVTGTSGTIEEDWHALWDTIGIDDGTFDERMLAWINDQLGTSYSNLPGAMHAYAANQGFDNWASMGNGVDFSDAGGGGGTAGEPIGLLLILTKAA